MRRTEDAFIPAKMLLGFAPRFGWEKARISDEMARLESAESIRKGQLKSKYQQVSGLVTKVRRMALGGLEGSAQLEESLRAVKIDGEPMSVTIDFLPEEIEGTRIADVNAAANRLSIIEVRARKLLDEAKLTFSDDIAKLAEEAKISPDERTELERLLAADDLATLSDWIPMFGAEEQSRPGLAGRVVNEELKRFFEISASTPNIELVSAKNAVVAGEQFGSFDFSCLNMERREEIRSILQQWFDFKRSMKVNSAYLAQIGPRLADLLSNVAYETEVIELNKAYSQERRSIFAIDAKMSLPFDTTSLMLPDFGSSTNDGWRIIAAPGTITNAEILSRAEGAEPRGVLVLVFGSLTLERRYQLKIECIKRRRKVLVIDELLLLTMLSAADPRPLTMFEIAQAFTTATPYQDYGRSHVPREMFKGRARERASIVNPHGSYIVYGGRRLGKTALLRHISRNRPEHGLFAYLDLVDSSSSALWERASGALKEAFAHPVGNSEEFDAGVMAYLDGDGRRRILLLLDEADNFIKEQANKELKHHHVFLLLSLMAETNHRFKFVLAGLHNVSRITRSENSPLAQISNDPVRIGPLVERDVGDAEILVRGPMSALGYEFANREDVWRILSYANYYPVLIQVFCQGLLRIIEEQTVRNSKVIKIIDGKMIDSAMADNQIRKALYESFDKTITHIEQRYELLTYIIAERALIDAGEGVDADGLTASEVADKAGRYWPEAFPKGSDPSEVEYLLDEMEGFGILRRTASGRWALRSRMLLDLMVTDEEELLGRIYSFKGKQPETQFDPKNSRRSITGGKRAGAEGKISPLTDGQEAEIMHSQLEVGGAVVLFGSSISNIEHVHIALETSHTALGRNQRKIQLEIRGWRDRADLITQIRAAKKNDIVKVMVVTNQTEWSPDWVAEAARQANVAKGIVRPVFVGDAKHALAWSNAYPLGMKTPPRVRIKSLRPWARSYVASRLDAINALKSPVIDSILESTGGWNDLCQTIFSTGASGNQLENAAKDLVQSLKRGGASERFGVPPYLSKAFNALSVWCPDGSSTADIAEVLRDISSDLDINVLLRFGSLVGILSLKVDPADSKRELMDMNVLARDILSSSAEQ
jgi:AAA domain